MKIPRKRRNIRIGLPHVIVLGITAACVVAVAGLAIIPAAFPGVGAETADTLRALVGVGPVAELESLSNRIRDDINRVRYAGPQAQPQISWSATVTPQAAQPRARTLPTPTASVPVTPTALPPDVVSAAPQLGWQAYGPASQSAPLMARTLLMVDPQRSYAGVALVRMDLSLLQLHMTPGTLEPAHPSGVGQAVPSLGMVPPVDQARLVAAFNGGFKSIHGHYGMMVNGITLLPPIDGMGTVAVYSDGSVQMGAWNQDLSPSPDMIAFRQNCPPLIDRGQLNPALSTSSSRAWGFTHNGDITWRTGLGLSQDKRFLIYAVGNGTDAKFLAEALQQAGAYWAMQLDINQYYAHFNTYSVSDGALIAQPLLDQMINNTKLYVTPSIRDFFYVTLR